MPPDQAIYYEIQRFRQWWLWLSILIIPIAWLWSIVALILTNSETVQSSILLTILGIILAIGFLLFMYTTGLKAEVTQLRLHINFQPFHLKSIVLPFTSFENADSLTYHPIRDYGGVGLDMARGAKHTT